MTVPGTVEDSKRSWLTRGVASVGLASFFSDAGRRQPCARRSRAKATNGSSTFAWGP
jgi:hypothetical protein